MSFAAPIPTGRKPGTFNRLARLLIEGVQKGAIVEKKFKLKPLSAVLSVQTPEHGELARWNTTLTPLHAQDGAVTAAAALLGADGRLFATGTVSGIPLADWPKSKPPGAPKKEEKHLQVLLSWAVHMARFYRDRRPDNAGRADDAVAAVVVLEKGVSKPLYSEGGKVRGIRGVQAEKLGLNLAEILIGHIHPESNFQEVCVFFADPAWYRNDDGSITVSGKGYAWNERTRVGVSSERIIFQGTEDGTFKEFDRRKAKGGPVIIALSKPG